MLKDSCFSLFYVVNSFDSYKGEEIFDCTARRRNGKYQSRSMKLVRSRNPRLSNGDIECEKNNCRNEGICLVNPNGDNYCMCVLIVSKITSSFSSSLTRSGASRTLWVLGANTLLVRCQARFFIRFVHDLVDMVVLTWSY